MADDPHDPRPMPDLFNLPTNEALAQSSLERRVAVRGAAAWTVVGVAGRMSGRKREPLPVDVLERMADGDELWWFCSPEETWDALCGRAGWAVVRGGRVIECWLTSLN